MPWCWQSALTLATGLLLSVTVGSSAAPVTSHENGPVRAVVFDTDVDFDDTVALAALAQQHLRGTIDLLAVTITNNGAGLPGKAYPHARCLLDSLGLPQIPIADATYTLPHAFPPLLRSTIDFLLDASIPDCPAGHLLPSRTASQLLTDVLTSARAPVTLIATGPLTNVALALDSFSQGNDGVPASVIERAVVEGGAIRVPGGLEGVPGFDGTQNLNTWGDPAASQTVFQFLRAGVIYLVADATTFVPVRLPYLARLAAEAQTPAAQYVSGLMNNPLLVGAVQAGLAVFWWDPLAALAATQSGLVQFSRTRIRVIQDGVSSGRTIEDQDGAPMWVGLSADTALFEDTLIRVLNGSASSIDLYNPSTRGVNR